MRHLFRGLLVAAAVVLPQAVFAHTSDPRPASVSTRAAELAQAPPPLDRARALASEGKHRDALAVLDAALASESPANRTRIAEMQLLRGASLRAQASRAAALEAATIAQAHGDALQDASLRVRARLLRARLAEDASDIATSGSLHDEAMRIAEAAGNTRLQIMVLTGLASHARQAGRPAEALQYQAREIRAADAAGDLDHAVRGRTGRATTLLGVGRYDEALADSERAYAIAQTGTPSLRGNAAFSLAQAHAHLWNLDAAGDLWDEAIARYREAGLQIGVALSLRQSMDTWLALGDFDRAAAAGAEALSLFEKTGSGGTMPDTLARMALIEARRGRPAIAAAYADRARASMQQVAARRRVFIENDLGLVALFAGDHATAARAFAEVRTLARAHGDVDSQWRGEYGLGRAALARGDAPAAHHHLHRAAAGVERMRVSLPDPGQRASFMIQRAMVHEALVAALLARSTAPGDWYAREAFDVAEAARARALADQLAEARARSSDPALVSMKAAESAFATRLAALQKAGRLDELERAEREYESLLARLRRENPRYASLAWPQPVRADDVSRLLRPGQALVSYLVGEQAAWGWALRDGRLAVFPLPHPKELDRLVRAVRTAGSDDAAFRSAAESLHRALIAPALGVIGDATRLLVIPDGVLHRLPFALLHDGRQWLVEHAAVSVAPSATVLAELRGRRSNAHRTLLALAASSGDGGPLPNAAAEAREAADLMGGWSSARVPAREEDVTAPAAGGYRVLHFAAHTRVDERVPRRSAIVLDTGGEGDGLLQVNEIAHLDLGADLVVLAACRSHMGRALRGEGFLNLSRAFMQGGARAVMASLWDVNDAGTRQIMQAFYRHAAAGAAPDEALQRAQLELAGRVPVSVWASMVVSGDAARPIAMFPYRALMTTAASALGIALLLLARVSAARRRERTMPAPTA